MSLAVTMMLGAMAIASVLTALLAVGCLAQRLGYLEDQGPLTAGIVSLAVVAGVAVSLILAGVFVRQIWARAVRGSAYRWERPTGPRMVSHRSVTFHRPALHRVGLLARAYSKDPALSSVGSAPCGAVGPSLKRAKPATRSRPGLQRSL